MITFYLDWSFVKHKTQITVGVELLFKRQNAMNQLIQTNTDTAKPERKRQRPVKNKNKIYSVLPDTIYAL